MSFAADVLIVGAGLSGLTVAERLSNHHGLTCWLIDRRGHIGGNAADEYDAGGVLTHRYGPHHFHSNDQGVVDYLTRFTAWHPVDCEIRAFTDGRYWHFPINLNTFEEFIGRSSTEDEFRSYLATHRVPVPHPRNSEDLIVSQVGWELYEKFFRGYTKKQWNLEPRDLDASVCGRIPIRTNRDNRYSSEKFQALPKDGYHKLFERMLAASPRVRLILRADHREVIRCARFRHVVYTGQIDEYYDRCYGCLPYRSLRFEHRNVGPEELASRRSAAGKEGFWQPVVQVNYPDQEAFTRVVEIKHSTGQSCPNTSIVYEYPADFTSGRDPYYPVPTAASAEIYRKYEQRALQEPQVTFLGRLARYRYYNMDQVVAMALRACDSFSTL